MTRIVIPIQPRMMPAAARPEPVCLPAEFLIWRRARYPKTSASSSATDVAGHEQRGPRYAVAIQGDGILLSALIVAPASTSAQPAIVRPKIEVDGTRTLVLADQMRSVDASRLGDFAGRIDAAEAGEVDRAFKLILGTL